MCLMKAQGLLDSSGHVMERHATQEMRVQIAFDEVASTIRPYGVRD